jgi:hypothetical protein
MSSTLSIPKMDASMLESSCVRPITSMAFRLQTTLGVRLVKRQRYPVLVGRSKPSLRTVLNHATFAGSPQPRS